MSSFGSIAPGDLVEGRRQLHHAALLVSSVGRGLAAKQRGYRHAALFWDRDGRALVGADVIAPDGGRLRAELRFDPPTIAFVPSEENGGRVAAETTAPEWTAPLDGLTFDAAWSGLRDAADAAGLAGRTLSLRVPDDLPAHPLRTGTPFAVDRGQSTTLARWFDFANDLLVETANVRGGSLPVACWCDHFDMAVAVDLATDTMITLGFSPGDTSIGEPYLYVLPYPVPSPGRLPGAPVTARWQTKGWVGLAQRGSALAEVADPVTAGRAFLLEGFEIAQDLLLTTP